MWCKACGSALPVTLQVCPGCGAHAGEPCAEGLRMGGLRIHPTGLREHVHGTTPAGLPADGEQRLFDLHGPDGLRLRLAYVWWSCGEREVNCPELHGVERLEVERFGDGWSVVDLGPVSEYEIDAAARACVRCALYAAGAVAMDTRQRLLGDSGPRRHRLCASFRDAADLVPAVAFTLVRVAPWAHERRARSA